MVILNEKTAENCKHLKCRCFFPNNTCVASGEEIRNSTDCSLVGIHIENESGDEFDGFFPRKTFIER